MSRLIIDRMGIGAICRKSRGTFSANCSISVGMTIAVALLDALKGDL
jgi:hypothetical protein